MTEDDIQRMAQESGFSLAMVEIMGPDCFKHFARLAYEAGAKNENDACAKVLKDEGWIAATLLVRDRRSL
jgi:hypothetical protein